ncbi:MAG: hypothetical protein K0S47_4721 [Herbinix sp.]|nr:hypothetical protein [Herbinix sp.]
MVTIGRASVEEVTLLTEIATEAFNHDARMYLGKELGPYGYNSVEWHQKKLDETDYYKILNEDVLAGGVYVSQISDNHYQLECIYLHPKFQGCGIGSQAMRLIEKAYPSVNKWTLDTPSWNPRTNHFYPSLGYNNLVLNLYEKTI